MSAVQYSSILVRLDSLERQVRWRRIERLLSVSLLAWLLASNPAATSLRNRLQSSRRISAGLALRSALDWTLGQVRDLVTVRPAVDPEMVLADEQEASRKPTIPAVQRAEVQGLVTPAPKLKVLAEQHPGNQVASSPRPLPPLAPAMTAAKSSTSQVDLHASIREAETALANVSENGPKLAAIVPNQPPLPATAGTELPPAQSLGLANSATLSAPAAAPVLLKALGYARSADSAQAILTDGVTLYVVNEGEEFADRFRLTGIRPDGLDLEDHLAGTTLRLAFGH